MEELLKEVELPKEVIEVQEALPLPPVEPQGGGVAGKSIVAILIAAAVIYVIGRVYCKK